MNLATQEIIEKVLLINEMPNRGVLFIQSTNNETLKKNLGLRLRKQCRIPEVLERHLHDYIPERDSKFIRNYIMKRLSHDGIPYDKGHTLQQAITLHSSKLVAGTIPMIGMFL